MIIEKLNRLMVRVQHVKAECELLQHFSVLRCRLAALTPNPICRSHSRMLHQSQKRIWLLLIRCYMSRPSRHHQCLLSNLKARLRLPCHWICLILRHKREAFYMTRNMGIPQNGCLQSSSVSGLQKNNNHKLLNCATMNPSKTAQSGSLAMSISALEQALVGRRHMRRNSQIAIERLMANILVVHVALVSRLIQAHQ